MIATGTQVAEKALSLIPRVNPVPQLCSPAPTSRAPQLEAPAAITIRLALACPAPAASAAKAATSSSRRAADLWRPTHSRCTTAAAARFQSGSTGKRKRISLWPSPE